MTIQYNGNDYYTVYLDNKKFILTRTEIDEFQAFDFDGNKPGASREELFDRIDHLEHTLGAALREIDRMAEALILTEKSE